MLKKLVQMGLVWQVAGDRHLSDFGRPNPGRRFTAPWSSIPHERGRASSPTRIRSSSRVNGQT